MGGGEGIREVLKECCFYDDDVTHTEDRSDERGGINIRPDSWIRGNA